MLQNDEIAEDLTALRAGDHGAFSALVRRYHRRMLIVARAIAGEAWAEEVTQEAWVSIFRALPAFEGRSSLQTWMFTIVRNEARTRLSKESRFVQMDAGAASQLPDSLEHLQERFREDGHWQDPPAAWHIDSPASLLEEQQLRRCIHHTLTLLSADQRAVFTLRDLQQMAMEDICNILDLSHSNVRVLLHRARLTLMQVIDRYQETGTC